MKYLLLGAAIALPLTLACDQQPTPKLPDLAADAIAEQHDDPDGPAAAPVVKNAPSVGTPVDAVALANIETQGRGVRGGENAKVQVMVFSDFECPYCTKLVPSLEEVTETYGDDVSVTFKQMPLSFHASAEPAARASLAAKEQGKFWEMHDALFASPAEVKAGNFGAIAKKIGLDVERFEHDMDDPELAKQIQRDIEDAKALGIRGTPSMVIGDQLVVGARPLPEIFAVIDAELAGG